MNPKEASAYMGMAIAYQKEQNYAQAMSYYQKATDLAPKNEDYKDAFNEFKESLSSTDLDKISSTSTDKDAEFASLMASGDKYFKNKNNKAALTAYEKALQLKADSKEALLKIGNIQKANKDYVKAGETYKKAISFDDKYTDAWFNLGLVYANTNKLTDAVDCFNKVVSIDTDYTYAYYALGLSYEYEHNNQKAIENYKKYVKLEHDQGLINAVNNKIKQLQK